jgi:hypothetical protein
VVAASASDTSNTGDVRHVDSTRLQVIHNSPDADESAAYPPACHARLSSQPIDLSESFFHRARLALRIMNSPGFSSFARAEAQKLWADLFRAIHSPRNETSAEWADRIAKIDAEAAKAGLSPILSYLKSFALDIAHAALIDPNPAKTLDRILNDPPKPGVKRRDFREQIEIAGAVEKLRHEGKTLKAACEEVSRDRHIGGWDAVRRIYENAMRDFPSHVRLAAAGEMEF